MGYKRTVGIDLDGTICTEISTTNLRSHRYEAKLLPGALESLQWLRDNGYQIIIYTGRDISWTTVTKKWLDDNNVPYDSLILGKVSFHAYLGNEAVHFNGNWEDSLKNLIKVANR